MKIKDVIKKLQKYNPESELFALNTAIEDDEFCPPFEIDAIESINAEKKDGTKIGKIVTIQFMDKWYIHDDYNLHKEDFGNEDTGEPEAWSGGFADNH